MLNQPVWNAFIDKHKLDQAYVDKAKKYYVPMIEALLKKKKGSNEPVIIGVNGCQGSGKSTISDLIGLVIESLSDYKSVVFSLDDFYLTKKVRQHNASDIHPLLGVRGVPGTHHVALLQSVINKLKSSQPVKIPKFNKALDDVEPEANWTLIQDPVDFIIVEGWCLGISAQSDEQLDQPINELEKNEDAHKKWRTFVNDAIQNDYQKIYDCVQYWVVLKAPSFSTVYKWRKEQEDKLKLKLEFASENQKTNLMSDEQVLRFIQFFERLTTHGFNTLPQFADYCFELDENREITQKFNAKVGEMS